MTPHGLTSLELMRRLVAEENRVGRDLGLHRWAGHLQTEDDIARLVRVREHPRKVLALDLDGTLWDGVLSERVVDEDRVPFLKDRIVHVRRLTKAGVLVALASKNDEWVWDAVAWPFDVAAHRINWRDKAANLLEIADELNLGIDSFAFLDDSPQERDRVATALPGVVVMDPARDLWLLDAMIPDETTPEDAARARMYAEEREREASKVEIPDETEWLASLEMRVVTRRAEPDDMPRVHQLFERTNQFNAAPGESLSALWLTGMAGATGMSPIVVAEASDRFGEYGIVGAVVASPVSLRAFAFALSCRVIGKGVAETLLASTRARWVTAAEHPRNAPLRRWLAENPGPWTVPGWISHEHKEN